MTTRGSLLGLTGALIAWSIYFIASYALLSVGCSSGWQHVRILGMNSVRLMIVTMALVTLLLTIYLGWRHLRAWRLATPAAATAAHGSPYPFMSLAAALSAALALVSTVWVGAPAVMLPTCA